MSQSLQMRKGNTMGYDVKLQGKSALQGMISSGLPKTDKTLTKAGYAADAMATGTALKEARRKIDEIVKKIWRG